MKVVSKEVYGFYSQNASRFILDLLGIAEAHGRRIYSTKTKKTENEIFHLP